MDNRARGMILRLCRGAAHNGITKGFIGSVLLRGGEDLMLMNLDENLMYLVGRCYLSVNQVIDQVSGVQRQIYRITPDGLDIATHLKTDPGVIYVD